MSYTYAVIGSGMQGTACSYDMGKFGNTEEILLADLDLNIAEQAAERVNKLLGKNIVKAVKLDVSNDDDLFTFLSGVDSFLSAVPYFLNTRISEIAIKAKANMCDLGGNTDVVLAQHKMNINAKKAGISIVPDCGLMPGMGNHLAAYGISQLDRCNEVYIKCGGLAQNPKPPLGYKLVFSIGGLTNEYFGKAYILRDGKVKEIDTFSELEEVYFDSPVGKCESFTTTGGTSTAPWTFEGKVDKYEYKTVRYPGHYDKFKTMMDLGLLDTDPVSINGVEVSPRDVFHKVVPPKIDFPEDKDLVVIRTTCIGEKDGNKLELTYDLMDFHNDETGFSAMERTTAFSASIVAIMLAENNPPKGVLRLEESIDSKEYVDSLIKRGFNFKETITKKL